MAIRNLTVDVRNIQGDPTEIAILVDLVEADWLRPDAIAPGQRGAFVQAFPITAHPNQLGEAIIPLPATADYRNSTPYTIRIGAGRPVSFVMPDRDANFYQLTQTPEPPPSPAALPLGLTDGDVVIGQDGSYALRKQLWIGPQPPTNPAQAAIWVDTSVSPHDPRITADRGATWREWRAPADMAAALNSLTGNDRISGRHIQDQIPIPIGTATPPVADYAPGDLFIVQASGQTAAGSLYLLTGDQQVAVGNQNRLQFVIAGNALQTSPPPTDNYQNILGSIGYNHGTRTSVLTIRLDTGVGTEAPPDQIWIRGVEPANALSEFRVDVAQPYTYSGGRRYKQLNNVVSAAVRAAGINGAQTWLLFTDLAGTQGYDFKPPVLTIPGQWVEIMGGTGGGGLSTAQVRALIADWAEQGNTATIPPAKLAAGGTTGQVLKRTATGQEWAADAGGLDQAAVDARIAARTKDYAETGGRTIQTGDIANDAITADKIATGAVGGTEIAPDSVGTSELANDAVTNAKIADDAVGQAQIAANSVGSSELQTNSVRANEIANNTIVDGNLSTATRGRLMPAGGDNDQLLAKASNSDYDTEWVDAPSGGTGSSTLTGLTDTPSSLGAAGEVLAVATGGATTEWVGQAMAGLDTQAVVAYRTYASSPSGAQRSAGVQLPADWATGNSFLYVLAGNSATTQGLAIVSIARLAATTSGTNVTIGDLSISGTGAFTLSWTPGTRTISVNGFSSGHRPRIQEVTLIRSAAATGSGLSQSQVDGRVRAIVEDWAEVSNAATIPAAKLASGGTDGQVLTRTATGQAWEAASGGLDQAAVDARVAAGVKDYAETGGRQIQSGDIGTGQVNSANIADATIVSGDIASDAITSANLAPNSVGASELANNAVDTAAIADDAVTRAKIGAGAVGSTEIGNNAVTSAKIPSLAISESKLASNAVSERTIQDDAVRAAQIQAGAVGTSELANDAVTAAKIDTDAVGAAEIAAGAVGTSELANNAVTPAQVHSSLASRLVPAGGDNDQILAKSSDSDYDTEWIDAPSGGTGAALVVTPLQSTAVLSLAATGTGFDSDNEEVQIAITTGTNAAGQGTSVVSNALRIAAGTVAYQGTIQAVLPVSLAARTGSATSGGQRLFFDAVLKKDGTELPISVATRYMRSHSTWAGHVWDIKINYTGIISPGDYTLHFQRRGAAGGGQEISGISVSGGTLQLNSESYSGAPAPGTGLTQIQTDARVNLLVADFAEEGDTSLLPLAKLAADGDTGDVLTRTATGRQWEALPAGSKHFTKRAYSTTGTQRTLAISATEDGVTWSDYHAIMLTFSVGSVEYNTTIPIGGLSVRTGLSTYVIVDEYFEWSGTTRTLRARNLNGLIRAAYLIRY